MCVIWMLIEKMMKMTISTSVWGAQHPNAGWNKQQAETFSSFTEVQLEN